MGEIMGLRKIGSVFAFGMAFAVGVAAAYIGAYGCGGGADVAQLVAPVEMPVTAPSRAPIKMGMFVGKWAGKWDHDFADCTLEVTSVSRNKFYGTLTKNEAIIAITGMVDRKTGKVAIHETKVLSLGAYSWWSLGENQGTVSADRRSMSGTGYDKNGEYNWYISLASSFE